MCSSNSGLQCLYCDIHHHFNDLQHLEFIGWCSVSHFTPVCVGDEFSIAHGPHQGSAGTSGEASSSPHDYISLSINLSFRCWSLAIVKYLIIQCYFPNSLAQISRNMWFTCNNGLCWPQCLANYWLPKAWNHQHSRDVIPTTCNCSRWDQNTRSQAT